MAKRHMAWRGWGRAARILLALGAVIAVAGFGSAAGQGGVGVTLARASNPIYACPSLYGKEYLQDGARTGTDQSWQRAAGVSVNTIVKVRDYNPNCFNQESGTAAMIRFVDSSNNITDNYIKVGYELQNEPSCCTSQSGLETPNGSETWKFYWEVHAPGISESNIANGSWGDNGCTGGSVPTCSGDCGLNCTFIAAYGPQTFSEPVAFRIVNTGGGNWKIEVDQTNPNGTFQGWHWFAGVNSVGYTQGIPESEDWRYGGESTGMSDVEANLQYFDTTARSWQPYSNNGCYVDNTSNWHVVSTSAVTWESDKGTACNP
jgi:hypothetical protein